MPTSYAGANVFPASFDIPADGEFGSAASVNVAIEALGDRTVYLQNRANAPAMIYTLKLDNASDSTYPTIDAFNTGSYVESTFVKIDVPGCAVGDHLLIEYSSQATVSSPVTVGSIRFYVRQDFAGTNQKTSLQYLKKYLDTFVAFTDFAIAGGDFTITVAGTARVG